MKTPEERLAAVRELSEGAMLRPAPKRLRLATLVEAEAERAPRPSPTAVEDFQALPTLGPIGRASGREARRSREVQSDAERWRGETFA